MMILHIEKLVKVKRFTMEREKHKIEAEVKTSYEEQQKVEQIQYLVIQQQCAVCQEE